MRHRDPLQSLRLQRAAEHLHDLGPRAVAELLAEIADRFGVWPVILATLAEYEGKLTREMVKAAGGHVFPPKPIRRVA